ncbi:MAG: hypothetical protein IAF38_21785, partial [Bacteroidia bacterium]|nr:hypothetical protein [Bacteroidia bacterium]
MKQFHPIFTWLFLGCVMLTMGILALIFPANGLKVSDNLTIKFPQLASFFEKNKKVKADISKIIAITDNPEKADSLAKLKLDSILAVKMKKDTLTSKVKKDVVVDSAVNKLITTIQFKDGKKGALDKLFTSLKFFKEENKSVRILHYGDSQIEGDRISDYLRMKLQNQFGGEGPGFISPMPVAPSVALRQSWSDNFSRYIIFTSKDKRVKHNNFGIMGSFCRFTPYRSKDDSSAKTTEAWIKTGTSKNGGPKLAGYTKVKMYYAGGTKKTAVEFYEGETLKDSDTLKEGGNFHI